jgi:hypothetical protein
VSSRYRFIPEESFDPCPAMANNHKRSVGFAEMLAIGESTATPEAGWDHQAPILEEFERVRGSLKKRH